MGLEVTWDGGDGGEGAACLEIPLARLEVSSPPGTLWLGGNEGEGRARESFCSENGEGRSGDEKSKMGDVGERLRRKRRETDS